MIRERNYDGPNPDVGHECVFHRCKFAAPAKANGGTALFEGVALPFTFVDCDFMDVQPLAAHNYIDCRLEWSPGMHVTHVP